MRLPPPNEIEQAPLESPTFDSQLPPSSVVQPILGVARPLCYPTAMSSRTATTDRLDCAQRARVVVKRMLSEVPPSPFNPTPPYPSPSLPTLPPPPAFAATPTATSHGSPPRPVASLHQAPRIPMVSPLPALPPPPSRASTLASLVAVRPTFAPSAAQGASRRPGRALASTNGVVQCGPSSARARRSRCCRSLHPTPLQAR